MEKPTLDIWTDGAVNIHNKKKPGGWSSVYVYKGMLMCTQWAGEAPTTNQRMEMMGALMGLKNIIEHKELIGLEYEHIRIYSDSAYLVNCFNQCWYIEWMYNGWITSSSGEPVKNQDIWEQLIEVKKTLESQGYKITWNKVKGHSGLTYNEVADKLAVKGKHSVS